ncbi:MAG: hypothetical protein EOO81_11165, partial [Oxalobacteraceae bacterium]
MPSRLAALPSVVGTLRSMVWLTVLPTISISAIAGYAVFAAERKAVLSAAQETVQAMGAVVDRELAMRRSMLEGMSVSRSLRSGDLKAFHAEASEFLAGAQTLVVTDLNGQMLLNTRLPWGSKLPLSLAFDNPPARPRALLVSNIYLGVNGTTPSFAVRIPIELEQGPAFMGVAGTAEQMQKVFERQPLPQGWLGVVLDNQGTVVSRTRDIHKWVGKQASPNLRSAIAAADSGITDSVTLDGVPVTTLFHRAPESGWVVILSLSKEELSKSAWQAFGITMLVSGFFILAAVYIARRMARTFVRPLKGLLDDAIGLREGKTIAVRGVGYLEIDTIQ